MRRVVAARPDDVDPLELCGVSCEGPIDREAGTVDPLHLPAMRQFELRERVRDLTGLPTVIGTAAHARVLAERWIGAAQGVDDVMVLLVSDAVEAGIVCNGRLLRGRRGNAGELGHVVVEPEGLPCPCGGTGMPDRLRVVVGDRDRDEPAAPAGSGAVIERTGMMIGRAVASAAAVLDLRQVLLAGAVPSVFGMPLLEAARRELDQRSRLAHLRQGADRAESRVELDFTAMGIEAPLVGAAALARLEALDSAVLSDR